MDLISWCDDVQYFFWRGMAFSYASCGVRVSANSSSAIFFVVHVCGEHIPNPFMFSISAVCSRCKLH